MIRALECRASLRFGGLRAPPDPDRDPAADQNHHAGGGSV
jgi:hypothetical protein